MLLSAKDIINKSLKLFKRDFKVWLPYLILSFVAALLSVVVAFNQTVLLFFHTLGVSSTMVWMLSIVGILLLSVFNVWLNLALVRSVHDRLFNKATPSLVQRFHESKHLLARNIGISILVSVIVGFPLIFGISGLIFVGFENLVLGQLRGATALYLFFGLLALYGIVHFVYFSVRYALSYYIVAIDEKKIAQSLHEGHMLTEGRMGEVFWRIAAPVILFLLIYVLSNNILVALAKAIGGSVAVSVAGLLSLAVSAVVVVLINISTVILYVDAKAKPLSNQKKM